MKVLLLKSVSKLGLPGDVKDVRGGFARNYLLPQGLAVLPSDARASALRGTLSDARASAEAARARVQANAKDWAGKTITITVKATGDGTLYASVTDRDIAKALELETKQVSFAPAKAVGTYEARVDLGEGVDAPVGVIVEAEKGSKKRAA